MNEGRKEARETPRNIAIPAGAVAAITAPVAGWTGYRIGQNTQPVQPPQIIFQPGSIQVLPAAPGRRQPDQTG
jgi:hypothetical protein